MYLRAKLEERRLLRAARSTVRGNVYGWDGHITSTCYLLPAIISQQWLTVQ